MAQKVCRNCGTEIPKGGKLCPNCSERVKANLGPAFACFIVIGSMVALMAQDRMDPENSWIRGPLRKARQRKAAAKQAKRGTPAPAPTVARATRPAPAAPATEPWSSPTPAKAPRRMAAKKTTAPPRSPAQKSEYYATFKPPVLGSEITVKLKSGSDVTGILLNLTTNTVEVEKGKAKFTLDKKQIMARSRIRLFADDHVAFREWLDKNKRIKAQPRDPGSRSESPVKIVAPRPLSDDSPPTTPKPPPQRSAADIFFDAFED